MTLEMAALSGNNDKFQDVSCLYCLLCRVLGCVVREWRKSGGNQVARHNTSQAAYDVLPSPGLLSSRKKQKTSQPVLLLSQCHHWLSSSVILCKP